MAASFAAIVKARRQLEGSAEGCRFKTRARDEPGNLLRNDPVSTNRDILVTNFDQLHQEDPR